MLVSFKGATELIRKSVWTKLKQSVQPFTNAEPFIVNSEIPNQSILDMNLLGPLYFAKVAAVYLGPRIIMLQ